MSLFVFVAELVGTFILCTAILATGEAIPIGIALAAAISVGSFVSGAHYNPAVTVMMVAKGRIAAEQLPIYVSGQVIGAMLAMVWYKKIPIKSAVHR